MRDRMSMYNPEAVFIYTCASRRIILDDNICFDEKLLECCPSSAVFFSFGEYYTTSNENRDKTPQQDACSLFINYDGYRFF